MNRTTILLKYFQTTISISLFIKLIGLTHKTYTIDHFALIQYLVSCNDNAFSNNFQILLLISEFC